MRTVTGRICLIIAMVGLVFSNSLMAKIFFLALFLGGICLVVISRIHIVVTTVHSSETNQSLDEQFDDFNRRCNLVEASEAFHDARSAVEDAASALNELVDETRYSLPTMQLEEVQDMRNSCYSMLSRLYELEEAPRPE